MTGGRERPGGPEVREAVVRAALSMIAERGWRATRCADLIAASGIGEADFYREFDDLASVIAAAARIDNAALYDAAGDFEPEDTMRERLFALLMARFDAAAPHKPAIAEIIRAAPFDPGLAATLLQAALATARQALAIAEAGNESAGVRIGDEFAGALRARLLAIGVILPATRAWLLDDSPDLSRTMAKLDALLARAESAARTLPGGGGGRAPDVPRETL